METQAWNGLPRAPSATSISSSPKSLAEATGSLIGSPSYAPAVTPSKMSPEPETKAEDAGSSKDPLQAK